MTNHDTAAPVTNPVPEGMTEQEAEAYRANLIAIAASTAWGWLPMSVRYEAARHADAAVMAWWDDGPRDGYDPPADTFPPGYPFAPPTSSPLCEAFASDPSIGGDPTPGDEVRVPMEWGDVGRNAADVLRDAFVPTRVRATRLGPDGAPDGLVTESTALLDRALPDACGWCRPHTGGPCLCMCQHGGVWLGPATAMPEAVGEPAPSEPAVADVDLPVTPDPYRPARDVTAPHQVIPAMAAAWRELVAGIARLFGPR